MISKRFSYWYQDHRYYRDWQYYLLRFLIWCADWGLFAVFLAAVIYALLPEHERAF